MVGWSEERSSWRVGSAYQRLADVAFSDQLRGVAEALKSAGHQVEVDEKAPKK